MNRRTFLKILPAVCLVPWVLISQKEAPRKLPTAEVVTVDGNALVRIKYIGFTQREMIMYLPDDPGRHEYHAINKQLAGK